MRNIYICICLHLLLCLVCAEGEAAWVFASAPKPECLGPESFFHPSFLLTYTPHTPGSSGCIRRGWAPAASPSCWMYLRSDQQMQDLSVSRQAFSPGASNNVHPASEFPIWIPTLLQNQLSVDHILEGSKWWMEDMNVTLKWETWIEVWATGFQPGPALAVAGHLDCESDESWALALSLPSLPSCSFPLLFIYLPLSLPF